jgi:UDP-N-acetylmuramoylalanine--D-glutamate ligase
MDLRKKFLVAGLGESGLAMARWLHSQGAKLAVADTRAQPPGLAALAAECPGIQIEAGPFRAESFAKADVVALSPGIDPAILPPFSAPAVGELDLFLDAAKKACPAARVLAITGSNGKTTTTALAAHLLNAAGVPAIACGNISPSMLAAFMAAQKAGSWPAAWVLELSSFQLETAHEPGFDAAALLNVSEDHLDRYGGDIRRYAKAKARIFEGGAARVLNRADPFCRALQGDTDISIGLDAPPRENDFGLIDGAIAQGGAPLFPQNGLPLDGAHNLANAMAALALIFSARFGNLPMEALLPGLKSFRGLPHRMEFVAEIDGVRAIDDSKGTNVGATLAAIAGAGAPAAVLLGGDGKGQDFAPLAGALAEHGRAAAVIGKDAAKIAAAVAPCGIPVCRFASMDSAVAWLFGDCQKGDVLLLSPACASWDMYRNYAHRAEAFRAALRKLKGKA